MSTNQMIDLLGGLRSPRTPFRRNLYPLAPIETPEAATLITAEQALKILRATEAPQNADVRERGEK